MVTNIKMSSVPDPQNMCRGCPAPCCKLLVELTTYDVIRIALFEKKALGEFMEAVEAKEDDAYFFKALGKKAKLVLKHRGGFCVFLNSSKGLKCGIEYSKPSMCLAYPFELHNGVVRMSSNLLCPPKNKALADYAKASKDTLEDFRWEWKRYQEVLDDWNRIACGHETPKDFLEFALDETGLECSFLGSVYRRIRRPLLKFMSRSPLSYPQDSH